MLHLWGDFTPETSYPGCVLYPTGGLPSLDPLCPPQLLTHGYAPDQR